MERCIRHHYLPLSCGMPDFWTNIMFLTHAEHKLVHKTLNVPYGRIRAFKKATNGILVVNNYYLTEQHLLLLEYFKNFKLLPIELQTLHCLHIEELCEFYGKEWKIPVQREIADTPEEYFLQSLKLYFPLLKIRIKR